MYQRLHRKLAEVTGGTANGSAGPSAAAGVVGAPSVPDVAVADHGLAATSGNLPVIDHSFIDSRYPEARSPARDLWAELLVA